MADNLSYYLALDGLRKLDNHRGASARSGKQNRELDSNEGNGPMNTTSKALLTYLASATALIVLFATAGNVTGQSPNQGSPRPPEIQPEPKKEIRIVSYTPITVTKAFPTAKPAKKGGVVKGGVGRKAKQIRAIPNQPVSYTFTITDFKECESAQIYARCREIQTFTDIGGYSVSTGNNPKEDVFKVNNQMVNYQYFEVDPQNSSGTATVIFPTTASGKVYFVGFSGVGENEEGRVDFIGGDIIVVE